MSMHHEPLVLVLSQSSHLSQPQSIQPYANMHCMGPGSKLTASQLSIKGTVQWPAPLWCPAVRLRQSPTCLPGLQDVGCAATNGEPIPVLLLIDTAGCGMEERVEEEGDSKSNDGEAQVCPFNGPHAVWQLRTLLAHHSKGRCLPDPRSDTAALPASNKKRYEPLTAACMAKASVMDVHCRPQVQAAASPVSPPCQSILLQ